MTPPIHQYGDSPYDPSMPHWAVRLESKVNQVLESQNRTEIAIHGTDEDPSLGLRTRVDRLEQSKKRQDWLSGLALTAAVGAFFTMLVAKLTGKG